jgi:glucose-1-phosphate cytidylyltransferase
MAVPHDTPVAILCGGRGTRLRERSRPIAKPLVEIGGMPIVWHVVQLYAAQGFREFVLLTGYLGQQVEAFAGACAWPGGVRVTCLQTGLDTPTGGRIAAAAEQLDGGTFCATYADGLADLDLAALLAEHGASGAAATMTVIRPELQFGVARIGPDDRVQGFVEKPRSEEWVNGGFLCLEPSVFSLLQADTVLERDALAALAARGDLHAHRHEGFWDCMDTYKDAVLLNDLWDRGGAPWKLW